METNALGKPFVRAVHSKGKTYFYLIQTEVENGKTVQKKLRRLSGEEEAVKLGWKNHGTPSTPSTPSAPSAPKTSASAAAKTTIVTSRKVEKIKPAKEPEAPPQPAEKAKAPVKTEPPAEKRETSEAALAEWPSEHEEVTIQSTLETKEIEAPTEPPSPQETDEKSQGVTAATETTENPPPAPETSLLEKRVSEASPPEPEKQPVPSKAEATPPTAEVPSPEAFEGEPFEIVEKGEGRYVLIPRWPGLTKGFVIKDKSGTFCGMCKGFKCDHTEYLLHHRHPFH